MHIYSGKKILCFLLSLCLTNVVFNIIDTQPSLKFYFCVLSVKVPAKKKLQANSSFHSKCAKLFWWQIYFLVVPNVKRSLNSSNFAKSFLLKLNNQRRTAITILNNNTVFG